MERIREIAAEYFNVSSSRLCCCSGGHFYCLNCSVCRCDFPDQTAIRDFPQYIDHTNLKPDTRENAILDLCSEAVRYGFFSVCINPCFIPLCVENVSGSSVKVCSVIGFPLGAALTEAKVTETGICIRNRVDELDMVINISFLKDRKIDLLAAEIERIASLCHRNSVVLKCIIESCLLTEEEKIIAALTVKKCGADFVKTSTGFSSGGAVPEDIRLLRLIVGNKMGVKASGGIDTREKAEAMIAAGADRIGTSKGLKLLNEH